ncbi:MAG: N-acetylmuramoyl-L-alanine amidase [Ignavibacteriae bacterium]|nr:N-acetylmuramoyl-L-alanine amidase [Ignavibacteriota bacterium]
MLRRVRVLNVSLLLILTVLSVSHAYQTKTITLHLENRPTVSLRGLDSKGVAYVSYNDFVHALALPAARNDTARKFEARVAAHRAKVSANNPFVVITELATNTASVSQLPQSVILTDTTYYVPLPSFLDLFSRLSPSEMYYDSLSSSIYFGTKAPGKQFDITGIELEPRLNGYLMTIKASRKLNEVEAWLKQDGWLFVTVPEATVDTMAFKRARTFGAIREILVFPSPTSVQLTFRVAPDVQPPAEIISDPTSNNIYISLRTRSEIQRAELERKRQEILQQKIDSVRARWKLDVIVIDAGHGGKDPGTVGVAGTKEKDVALSIALKLGRLIEQNMKDVKVVYTRKTDTFVELYRRSQIANEAGGKLFVCIHCNSTPRKPSNVKGLEIYLLRTGKEDSAIEIAERENSVIQLEENYQQRYKELISEESFILLTMAQSAFMRYSENCAEILTSSLANELNSKRGKVRQAGFYVLVGASMPSVYVETGYLSNRDEERVLRSARGQNKIAQGLFKGIKEYKETYEKTLREGDK